MRRRITFYGPGSIARYVLELFDSKTRIRFSRELTHEQLVDDDTRREAVDAIVAAADPPFSIEPERYRLELLDREAGFRHSTIISGAELVSIRDRGLLAIVLVEESKHDGTPPSAGSGR